LELDLPRSWDRLTVPELIPDVIFPPFFGTFPRAPISSITFAFFGEFK